ncbi:hypothetical protein BES36_005930 [Haemophilus quentini]|nr:hypothetical protein BES36_005930 [Haemophilus quentini]
MCKKSKRLLCVFMIFLNVNYCKDCSDFLRLVNITRPPYIFFSSTKSEFVRFIEYMQEDKIDNWQAFDNAQRIVVNASASYSGKYEDNMVYKF